MSRPNATPGLRATRITTATTTNVKTGTGILSPAVANPFSTWNRVWVNKSSFDRFMGNGTEREKRGRGECDDFAKLRCGLRSGWIGREVFGKQCFDFGRELAKRAVDEEVFKCFGFHKVESGSMSAVRRRRTALCNRERTVPIGTSRTPAISS